MIDFHSHLLPGIDDGSRNTEVTQEILRSSKAQGVTHMVATPHFYPWNDRIEDFLNRRDRALEETRRLTEDQEAFDHPELYLGCEVAYFRGISRAEGIEALTIRGTDIFLLEMPYAEWSRTEIDETAALAKRGFTVVLAHLERFAEIRANKKWLKAIMELPVLVQVNADSLFERKSKKLVFDWFEKGRISFLGSDCHGMHRRPPNLAEGREVLMERFGRDCLEALDKENERLLMEAEIVLR